MGWQGDSKEFKAPKVNVGTRGLGFRVSGSLKETLEDRPLGKRPVGIIDVKIMYAKNLLKKDLLGKADPYVKIQLVQTMMSKTTTVKMSTLNPVWNESFKLLFRIRSHNPLSCRSTTGKRLEPMRRWLCRLYH